MTVAPRTHTHAEIMIRITLLNRGVLTASVVCDAAVDAARTVIT